MFNLPEHRVTRPGKVAILGSVVLHGLLAAGMLAGALQSGGAEEFEYKVYKVDLYSPPPQELGEPEAAKPEPAIVRPEPHKEQPLVKEEKPAPKPAPKPPPKKTVTPSTAGKSEVAKGRNPDPKSLVGGEGVDVQLEGEEFPYPEYLENIILQLNRYFRWSGAGNLEAKVAFEIMRDGSVRRIRVLQKSGNINFDLEAVSAIEQAGKRGAFGALPKGWVNDRLPISFSFLPPGR
jgi:outer membrane biosynthesis protein TonB